MEGRTEIVLATLNAKYIHAAFGLRYLYANLGDLQERAGVLEFDINQRPLDIVESIIGQDPRIVGFGVYIWNVEPTLEVITLLKQLRPGVTIVLGGPEVSYETGDQQIISEADYVITGEGDLAFGELCHRLLREGKPDQKIIPATLPQMAQLQLPYGFYTDKDIAHRILYVEASRGCPFSCEFCLSSLDIPVRQVDLDQFLAAIEGLLARGAKQLKFVDRTFNLNLPVSRRILEFLLARWQPGHFYHFEMVPDRLPKALREIIAQFPPGVLQFEVGIQTFNPAVAELISRRQNYEKLEDNFRFLRQHTGVHLHADLIAGLPGETWESFAQGFDRLVALDPQEIQVGILKRLRGTPIARHTTEWKMVYSPVPPYEILENGLISFPQMQRLRRFAKYWDLLGNSGNFKTARELLWSGHSSQSPFRGVMAFSDWLHAKGARTDGIALVRLVELMFTYITRELNLSPEATAERLVRDYQGPNRSDVPACLRPFLTGATVLRSRTSVGRQLPKRQARHLT